ncbi:hypothetical protein [Ruficoccus sp. ZRK36]|uniref:hypothetical protein n=1 Tax=Ruficoccus sp. ZRK36 TaxID=2866311 RepID=UPI0021055FD9|nr:hypothetical protein [Ruficoccus sp. ZRK36]
MLAELPDNLDYERINVFSGKVSELTIRVLAVVDHVLAGIIIAGIAVFVGLSPGFGRHGLPTAPAEEFALQEHLMLVGTRGVLHGLALV